MNYIISGVWVLFFDYGGISLDILVTRFIRSGLGGFALTIESNKAVVRRLTQAGNATNRIPLGSRDGEVFASFYMDEVVVHASSEETRTMDHETHWQEALSMFEMSYDLEARIENLVAEGDRVFVKWTYSGTHRGKTEGGRFEPTEKKATWGVVV